MCARENTIILRIFGQNFQLRAEREDRDRLERVASAVDDQIRNNKRRGAISDTRAAVMAAFEIGCELDALVPLVDAGKDAKNSIESTGEAMDRLLSRLNREIDQKPIVAAAPQKKPSPAKPNLTKPNLTKPNLTKPNLAKPNLAKPNPVKSSLTKPSADKPIPTRAKPTLAKPLTEKPIPSSQPSFLDPLEQPNPKPNPTQEAPPRGTSQSESNSKS